VANKTSDLQLPKEMKN